MVAVIANEAKAAPRSLLALTAPSDAVDNRAKRRPTQSPRGVSRERRAFLVCQVATAHIEHMPLSASPRAARPDTGLLFAPPTGDVNLFTS